MSTASRPVVIAGNWKMHMTCAEARAFAQDFMPLVANTPTERTVVLAPPFTAIAAMEQALSGSRVQLSSQNVHWEGKGAFTANRANTSVKATNKSTTEPAPRRPPV